MIDFKQHSSTVSKSIFGCLPGASLLVSVATFAVLTKREVSEMLTQIGERTELTYLGWAYGADVVACLLVIVAATCLGFFFSSVKTAPPMFQPVAETELTEGLRA